MFEFWISGDRITPSLFLNDALPHLKFTLGLQVLTGLFAISLIVKSRIGAVESKFYRSSLLVFALLIQTFQYMYHCGYLDEVYVNLEHSWNLYHFGRFSFSPNTMVDGTVEFVYYLILTPFAWSHRSLITASLILGWLITLGHTLAAWRISKDWPVLPRTILMLGFAWNPVFAQIQGAGFGNGLVSLIYFWGFVAIWEDKWRISSLCVAVLPLLRPDAIVYSVCLLIGMGIRFRRIPVMALLGMILSSGIFLIAAKLMYGHWILTPVIFKKTAPLEIFRGAGFQIVKMIVGLSNIYLLSVFALLLISTLPFIALWKPQISPKNQMLIRNQSLLMFGLYLFFVFTGRHFAAETRRYYLPFEFIGFFLLMSEWGIPAIRERIARSLEQSSSTLFTDSELQKNPAIQVLTTRLILIIFMAWIFTSATFRIRNNYYDRFWNPYNSSTKRAIEREDDFSIIARVIQNTMPARWRIATTELQGLGYLLDHNIDPLYGYANRRMATSKIFAKQFSKTKTDPNYLRDSKPEVIWNPTRPIVYPLHVEPIAQTNFFGWLQTDRGFDLNETLAMYPKTVVIQNPADWKISSEAVFMIRSDLDQEMTQSLIKAGYRKVLSVPYALDQIKEWSKANPF